MIRSLRLRLLLTTSLASAAVLALLGIAIYGFMWELLRAQFNDTLHTEATAIANMVEQHGPVVTFDSDLGQMPEFGKSVRHPEYFQVWLDDGRVLARSASLAGKNLARPVANREAVYADSDLPDGHDGRMVAISFPPRVEHDEDDVGKPTPAKLATIVVAGRPAEMHHTLDTLEWLLATLCSAAVIASGIVQYQLVGRAVRPVRRLAMDIESLRETELSRRLESPDVPLELAPVVEKLNGLLARLEESFTRERSFTADVAHELRTPLAGLSTTLEVCRSRSRAASEYESAIDDCRAMTDRLRAMVESLLLLARADAGQLVIDQQAVDVTEMIEQSWLLVEARATDRGLIFERHLPQRCMFRSDPEKLRIVLNNILENAVSYTNDGGSIRVTVSEASPGTLKIELANTGNQIAAADVSRLFDRFYRGDQSRSDTGVHCGLGLSLCRRLMRLMGGKIDIDLSTPPWFVVRLWLGSPSR